MGFSSWLNKVFGASEEPQPETSATASLEAYLPYLLELERLVQNDLLKNALPSLRTNWQRVKIQDLDRIKTSSASVLNDIITKFDEKRTNIKLAMPNSSNNFQERLESTQREITMFKNSIENMPLQSAHANGALMMALRNLTITKGGVVRKTEELDNSLRRLLEELQERKSGLNVGEKQVSA